MAIATKTRKSPPPASPSRLAKPAREVTTELPMIDGSSTAPPYSRRHWRCPAQSA